MKNEIDLQRDAKDVVDYIAERNVSINEAKYILDLAARIIDSETKLTQTN